MDKNDRIKVFLGLVSAIFLLVAVFVVYCCRRRSSKAEDLEMRSFGYGEELEPEDLIGFPGGEHLTIHEILDAPGEVVGKSSYGTLYMASLQRSNSVVLLRFLRPACTEQMKVIVSEVQMLGFVRHPNLVPLQAFYSGTRGEKLLVHPFFFGGTLSQLLRDKSDESHRWPIVYKISLGIAEGLDYLHNGLQKPIIHGNLKSKNILLDSNCQPYISDFGLHLLLNPTAGQEVLEASADQGYKAPELIKLKDASKESDIYSLGVIFLEMLTRKEPINRYSSSPLDLYLPTSMQNAALSHTVTEMFDLELLRRGNCQNSVTEDGLLMYFQLASSCCSPSPSLRPDTKQIIRKLEEIGRQ
ncbi:putative kinase-like protein TMKL1 [Cinnamomum micranthum f. kanehirae]|uniref:Putative kinase-like protein TMKL1 n=1 Tax=Cinnamomum micranthum f. kanehirae TaxID=337451 RepID=A0A443P9I0_9MAGN|nr:putative kinase-like protein TMKL1 [Cinnamomum micranthum f. kanehirae]